MHALSAAGFAVIVAVLVTSTAMAIEEPRFKVLEKDGSFELREYSAYIVAETRVEAGFEDAGSIAFQRLFRYISGNNVAQQKIAMTAPVTQSGSEKIKHDGAGVAGRRRQRLPRRLHSAVDLYARHCTEAAGPHRPDPRRYRRSSSPAGAIRGGGRKATIATTKCCFASASRQRELVTRGDAVLARYNPPFTPWFMRRNEVLIPVAGQPKR